MTFYLIKKANLVTGEYEYSIVNEIPSNLEYSKVYPYSSLKEAKQAIRDEKVFNIFYVPVVTVLFIFKKLFGRRKKV